MRQFILLVTLLSSLSVYGQKKTSSKGVRFFIGANFSPDYCYRIITRGDKSLSYDQWINAKRMQDSIFIPKFGYTTGIGLRFQFNKRISIETGLQYSNKGYKSIPIHTFYNSNPPFVTVVATNILNYHYYDFPLRVNYYFLKSRVQIIASGGMVLNVVRQVRYKIIPETTSNLKTKTNILYHGYNKINISLVLSTGLKYNLNKRMNFQLEPTFRYGLLPINKSSLTNHLWNAGLNLSYFIGL